MGNAQTHPNEQLCVHAQPFLFGAAVFRAYLLPSEAASKYKRKQTIIFSNSQIFILFWTMDAALVEQEQLCQAF